MDWGRFFNSETLLPLAWPVGAGIAVIVIMVALRYVLYKFICRWSARTQTCFDDIVVRDTRLASLLWCIWLGIYVGFRLAPRPEEWTDTTRDVVPVLFVALGIYSGIVVIMAVFKWYRAEVCPQTKGNLDDLIMSFLIFGTPIVGVALGIILILKMLGYENQDVTNWLSEHLPSLAFLIALAVALLLMVIVVVPRLIQTAVRKSRAEQTEEELTKRADTLTGVVVTTLQIIIMFVFGVMIISQVLPDTNIAPLLTGAGVLGLAVGFGAQSLVKDVLAGLFVIMENQYRKGDVVKIADVSGVVEEINLRRTVLRDLDGAVHTVPNGEIRVASNFTKQWSRANLNISVSYDTDLEKAMAVINKVGQELAADPQWAPFILTAPRALRVENLGDSGIEIKIVGDTKPIKQWDVMGELRLRLKKAFDEVGIEIPYPHTKLIFERRPPERPKR